jgi:hypothetical protein
MTPEDADAFEHYDDPANREPAAGEARRRRTRALGPHVPVRFPAETIEWSAKWLLATASASAPGFAVP